MWGERVEFDERDAELLALRQAARDARAEANPGPMLGDVITYPDGTVERVAHHWGDTVQPSSGQGSHYMSPTGGVEFSGGLDSGIALAHFTRTGRVEAAFWFFHHDSSGAHRGVQVTVFVSSWACDHIPRDLKWRKGLCLTVAEPSDRCPYRYLITKGGSSHRAFLKRHELDQWMGAEGWAFDEPFVDERTGYGRLLIKA